tara:strand:+ start:3170 stop:4186 length:1017 start_codon:yes stop_codon:yes gene_type:complete
MYIMEFSYSKKSNENKGSLNTCANTSAPNVSIGAKKVQIRQKIAINSMLAEAEALENAAHRLRRDAEQAEMSLKAEARYKRMRSSWRVVLGFMEQGMSEAVAVRQAANNLALGEETIQAHWDQAKKRRAIVKKWSRDREIFRLAHTQTNGQLAATFGISKVTVSRAIRAALKKVHMRKPIIALAVAFLLAAPLYDDAMAAETCPIDHAIYSAKEAPEFKITFFPYQADGEESHVIARVTDPAKQELVSMTFTFNNGYSLEWATPVSSYVTRPQAQAPSINVAFYERDFGYTGIGGNAGDGPAPYALSVGELGQWLYYGSMPNSVLLPLGAWILTDCRK